MAFCHEALHELNLKVYLPPSPAFKGLLLQPMFATQADPSKELVIWFKLIGVMRDTVQQAVQSMRVPQMMHAADVVRSGLLLF